MSFTTVYDAKYIAIESYKKDGTGIKTPVWQVAENGKLYVWTEKDSWKVKRIRKNSEIRVAKCDMRGGIHGEWMPAFANLLDDPAEEQMMQKRLAQKYGLMFRFYRFMGGLRGGDTTRTVIEISSAE